MCATRRARRSLSGRSASRKSDKRANNASMRSSMLRWTRNIGTRDFYELQMETIRLCSREESVASSSVTSYRRRSVKSRHCFSLFAFAIYRVFYEPDRYQRNIAVSIALQLAERSNRQQRATSSGLRYSRYLIRDPTCTHAVYTKISSGVTQRQHKSPRKVRRPSERDSSDSIVDSP